MELPELRILETVLYADDLTAAEEFYERVFGLKPFIRFGELGLGYRLGGQVFLIFNPAQSGLADRMLPRHGSHGPGHIAFLASTAEMEEWRKRLGESGIEVEFDYAWAPELHSIYFRDPAGNLLEFTQAEIWDHLAGS